MPAAASPLPLLHPSLSWAGPLFALRRQLGVHWPGLLAIDGTHGPVGEALVRELGTPGRACTSIPALLFDGADPRGRLAAWMRARRDQHALVAVNPPAPLLVFHDIDDGTYASVLAWEEEAARMRGLSDVDPIPDAVRIEGDAAGLRDVAGRLLAVATAPAPPSATLFAGPLAGELHGVSRLEYDRGVEEARLIAARRV